VVDLSPQCEVRLKARYEYGLLERIDGAAELIGQCAGAIWQNPETFDVPVDGTTGPLTLRWRATARTTGLAIVHGPGQLLSVSLLASGLEPDADRLTLEAFQNHVVLALHDTGYEPAFGLIELLNRPMVATVGFFMPDGELDRRVFAMVDRCFAAAFFRRLGLA
jgi:hypothetical protein